MTERAVTQVMQQSGQPDDLSLIVIQPKVPTHEARHVKHTEGVIKASVQGTWIDEIGHRKLANPNTVRQVITTD